jgi:hypothetical protein
MEPFIDQEGPIEKFSWGKFIVLGQVHSEHGEGVGKDIRIIGTMVTEWKERKGHNLSADMITGVFDSGIEILVIGIGVESAIRVPEATQQAILDRGIKKLFLLPTPQACGKFNSYFREGRRIALLAHGTC